MIYFNSEYNNKVYFIIKRPLFYPSTCFSRKISDSTATLYAHGQQDSSSDTYLENPGPISTQTHKKVY